MSAQATNYKTTTEIHDALYGFNAAKEALLAARPNVDMGEDAVAAFDKVLAAVDVHITRARAAHSTHYYEEKQASAK